MSDAMTESQIKEARKEKAKEALKTLGHIFVVDIFPQVAKIAIPFLLAYFSKEISNSNLKDEPNVSN